MDMNFTRRQFIKGAAILGAGMALPLKFGVRSAHAFYQSPGLSKYATTLRSVGPGQIPVAIPDGTAAPVTGVTHYKMAIQQFTDQLHPTFGPNSTKLWGFNPYNALGVNGIPTPAHLGGIIVAQKGTPIQITFRNNLPATAIIPVDTTIPGANQAKNRIAVHLHGGLVPWISDGGPFDWWAPNGTHGLSFLNNQVLHPSAAANEAEYYYGNNQSARFVWYHDHAWGITRINAYAGVASGYIIRDAAEAAMRNFGLPDFIENGGYELPIIIQDKIFVSSNIGTLDPTWVQKGLPTTPGSLWYPHIYEKNRWRLLGSVSRLPNPSVIPEMFGDTMLVNGTVYPQVSIEARPYRFRILNACNARFLNLQLLKANTDTADGVTIVNGQAINDPGPNWLVLGTEGGFLSSPVTVPSKAAFDPATLLGSLITGNAERWDVIVDFTGLAGNSYILYNDAPAPFPGPDPRYDYYFGNVTNPVGPSQPGFGPDTRIMMKFNVVPAQGTVTPVTLTQPGNWNPSIDPFLIPVSNIVNGTWTVPSGATVRRLTINEQFDAYGRLSQLLGTDTVGPSRKLGRTYLDPATETPAAGDVEVWEIGNLTGDTHPVHFHLVNVQILDRYPFNAATYVGGAFTATGPARPPEAYELGWKETVQMHPGEVTRVIMKFDVPQILKADGTTVVPTPPSPRTGGNEYVWHCHILEHEEHDMMRPLVVS
jgi:spore coat protein A